MTGYGTGHEPTTSGDEARRRSVPAHWNDTARELPGPEATLPALIAAQAARTPEHPALVFGATTLSYAELDARAADLAALLAEREVGPGRIVALTVPRSLELVVALLAVLRTGAAYLPVDPDYPADRIDYLLGDAAPALLLTHSAVGRPARETIPVLVLDQLPERPAGLRREPEPLPGPAAADAAYVIYTSGSTGRPKGVVVPHAGIVNRLHWMQAEYGLTGTDRVLQKTPSGFDVSVWEFFWPLITGATLVVARPEGHRDPAYLAELIRAERITTAHFVPSMLQAFVDEPAAAGCTGLRRVICSGEALPIELAGRFRELLPDVPLHNLYGPTEASVDVTYWQCVPEPGARSVPIGRPVWNTRTHVLDAGLRPVAVGEEGELYLSGVQLARGYLGRPGLTAERFVADPYGPPGTRMYRTGDLARWRADGVLEYAGRADHQVKIRGLRIELGEIEAALDAQPAVAQSAVLAREDRPGSKQLVAYLVPAPGAEPDPHALRAAAAATLPEYMVPGAFVVLDAFPLTPNGKLDRKALPAPDLAPRGERTAPRTERERVLHDLVAELLDLPELGVHDSFFDLGGDSIRSIQLVSRARRAGLALTQHDVFTHRTVAALALVAAESGTAAPTLAALPDLRPATPDAAHGDAVEYWPLTALQQGLLFHAELNRDALDVYSVQLVLDLAAEPEELRAAVATLLERHPNLRSGFTQDGREQPVQFVPAAAEPEFTVVRYVGPNAPRRAAEHFDAQRLRRFDLAAPPLLRVTVADLGPLGRRAALTFHHILLDGWSLPLILAELRALLAGAAPRPVTPYRDHLALLAGRDRQASLGAWQQLLDGLEEPTLLAPAGPAGPADRLPEDHWVELPQPLTARLDAALRGRGLTLNTAVQSVWALLLARLTGRTDVVFGATVSGRPPELPGIETMVGLFINTVPVRVEVAESESLAGLLGRVQEQQAVMAAHQYTGLADIQRAAGHGELFDTLTVFESFPADLAGADSRYAVHYPLALLAHPGERLRLRLSYHADRFTRAQAERLGERVLRLLTALAEDLDQQAGRVDLLSAAEREQLLVGWNDTDAPAVERTLPDLFQEQAARTPERIALIAGEERLTYAELNARANRLAHELIARGVRPEQFVALALPRDARALVALLAVLKAGAGYLPVDPGYPAERIAYLLQDAAPALTLTTAEVSLPDVPRLLLDDPALAAGRPDGDPEVALLPQHPAYAIYTSGSTGRPKGVVVPHAAVANLAAWAHREFGEERLAHVLCTTSLNFDVSVFELFGPLLCGGTVELLRDLLALADRDGAPASLISGVPSALAQLVAQGDLRATAATVVLAGEGLSGQAATEIQQALGADLLANIYGPTETTVYATAWSAAGPVHSAPPIGRPLRRTRAYVLDAALRPVPAGVAGELYIAGSGLARGYLGRAGLTAERFVADPYGPPGSRMYRTGDLARWGSGGVIDYLGRVDHQVKVRGFRVELGEIEAELAAVDGVAQAVAVVREDRPGDRRLVGYVIGDAEPAAVRRALAERLPEYLVPSAVVVLEAFPLNANGKLDRKALPAPASGAGGGGRAARDAREELLCALFAEVLGIERAGVRDNFFELGGHSLLATRLVSRIRSAFGAELGVRALFDAPTPEALALRLDGAAAARAALGPLPRPERTPLSHGQQRLWFLGRMEENPATHHIPLALHLTGPLDVPALRAALADLAERHEVLRTVFPTEADRPYQLVLAGAAPEPELASVPAERLAAALTEAASRPFDLATEPPLRAHLFALAAPQSTAERPAQAQPGDESEPEHVLLLVLHHIAADGWSLAPLQRDLTRAYTARTAGQAPQWEELPVQYADFTLWQRDVLGDEHAADSPIAQQLAFWQQALAGLPDQLELPTDRPRPARASYRGETLAFELDAGLHRGLLELARAQQGTLFMVLQAALATLLTRLGAGTDIPIGSPVAGRTDEALDDLVGFFINNLVLRTDTSGDPAFTELLRRVRDTDLAAYGHQDVPFERLVEVLNPDRSLARHPLFQIFLALQNTPAAGTELPALTARPLQVALDVAKFDLSLYCEERPGGGIAIAAEYSTDLYDRGTVQLLLERLRRLLEAFVADPEQRIGRAALLSEAEYELLLHGWNDTARPLPQHCVTELFEARAAASPQAVAVLSEAGELSYRDLDERANRLAHLLIAEGVRPEDFVAVALPRTADLVVALLAVLKTGAGYLPLDPDYPVERIDYMLQDAAPALVITTADLPTAGAVPRLLLEEDRLAAQPAVAPGVKVSPATPAYVIYTSGSTGRPKGVVVPRSALGNFLAAMCEQFPMTGADRLLSVTTIAFDIAGLEMYLPLLSGAGLVVAAKETVQDPAALAALIAATGTTVVQATPSLWQALIATHPQALAGLRTLVGGEALPPALAARLHELSARATNMYGPTETTIWSTTAVLDGRPGAPGIGRPMHNTRIRILDGGLALVAPGVAGELYIAGDGLARGYLGRPGLTAERFVADPYGPAGARMYRTGDLARWGADGTLEYLGRVDHQVKLRGFRIELGEIEAVLAARPGVTQAAVLVREDRPGDRRLVGYLVGDAEPAAVRRALAERLPDYMVPGALVVLDRMPLTPNGKLDRKALPAPAYEEEPGARQGRPARTVQEELLAELFAEILGLPTVPVEESFFELGGHSLLAIRLLSRIRSVFNAELKIRQLFEAPTVAALAERLAGAGGARPALRRHEGAERPERLPLSYQQSRLWFLNRFEGGSALYNIPLAIELRGRLDRSALAEALADLTERQDALRTVFAELDGEPYQLVLDGERARPVLHEQRVERAGLDAALRLASSAGFDLAEELPLRAHLFELSEDDHVLLLVLHHIAADGPSTGPLTRDLSRAYAARSAGAAPQWSELPVRYGDYTLWQREVLGAETDRGSQLAQQLEFWRTTLAGLPDQLDLPTDRPRPAVAGYLGAAVPLAIPAGLHRRLQAVARESGATVYMALQAALAALLSRLGAGSDIPIGSPIAARTDEGLDQLVGFFVNTLVMRTDTSGDPSFAELLGRVREYDLAAYAHPDLPFERLVELVNPARSLSRHPLFQVMLAFQESLDADLDLPGLTATTSVVPLGLAKVDLALDLVERRGADGGPGGIEGVIEYSRDLFDHGTVERFAGYLLRLLESALQDPGLPLAKLDLLPGRERAQLLEDWNDTAHEVPAATLPALFEAQAARTPDADAVVFGDTVVSYRELNERANRLAHHLIALGVGPEQFVALAVPRSVDMVVGLLAVVKAGAAYLPIDPGYPADRIAYMLADGAPALVLTTTALAGRLAGDERPLVLLDATGDLDGLPVTDPADADRTAPLTLAHPGYVIYTSGSTGRPKGVVVSHAGIASVAGTHIERLGLDGTSRFLLVVSISFDVSMADIAMTLASGAALVLPGPDQQAVGRELYDLIVRHRVTHTDLVAPMLASLPDGDLPTLRGFVVGGEALPADLVERWSPGRRVMQVYGPTEATVVATMSDPLSPAPQAPPIGRPVWNTRTHVLDAGLQPAPVGVPGELYIAGAGLARGYWQRPALTGERFVADPYGPPGSRMYRTGDLVRRRADGNLEFLGRVDHQVKVRGFRIELGEVETALAKHPGVGACAVVVREGAGGVNRLVGYAVPADASDRGPDPAELRAFLGALLPDYMVPTVVVVLDALPLTPSGKLDRKALPEPDLDLVVSSRGPRDPQEEVLCRLFADVLGLERIGIDDSFFDLGGHSLLATRLVGRIRTAIGVELGIRALFEAPTVARLAERLGAAGAARPALTAAERPAAVPLSHAQRRLWFLNRMEGPNATYNIPLSFRLHGPLDQHALHAALADLTERHESLRTVFPDHDGTARQHVLAPAEARPALELLHTTEAGLAAAAAAAAAHGFDLAAELPLRATLFILGEQDHVLLLTMHHIATDGWSMAPLTRDLATAYAARTRGRAPAFAPLPVQYADYTLWQQRVLGAADRPGSVLAEQLTYWRRALDGLPDLIALPTDRPRPAVAGHRGEGLDFRVEAALHAALTDLARQQRASLFMVLQAGLAALFTALGAGPDIPLGTPVAGRTDEALEELVGFFINTLVLRTDTAGDPTFRALLERVREADLAAYAHQDLPFEQLVEALNPARSLARHPLFQVLLTVHTDAEPGLDLPGLRTSPYETRQAAAKFDLTAHFSERLDEAGHPAGLDATLRFNTDLYDRGTVEQLVRRLLRLLTRAAAEPDRPIGSLEILEPAERERLLTEWSGADRPAVAPSPLLPVPELFQAQVERTPDRPALRADGRELSYAELNARANRLARLLVQRGAGPERLVALALPRSVDQVVALLAVLKSGAAYLPIDPAHPAERIAYTLADAAPTLLLTTLDAGAALPAVDGPEVWELDRPEVTALLAGEPDTDLADADRLARLTPGHPAYVIYTSGSTGRPKGVVVEHRSVADYLGWTAADYPSARGVALVHSPVSFDLTVTALWTPLVVGGCVHLAALDEDRPTRDALAEHPVTFLKATPSHLPLLTALPPEFSPSGELLLGGEALTAGAVAEWRRRHPDVGLVNVYGPTEATVNCTEYRIPPGTELPDGPVPIGRPFAGTRAYVLDAHLRPTPPGVPGEFYIAGASLARGYLGRPGLTAERFVADPHGPAGARMYRTGDLATWRADGNLVYLGRADDQVKLRGFRIELGEIETALTDHHQVRSSAVVVREDQPGDQRLVAYVVGADGPPDTAALRAALERALPEYMVPSAVVALDRLPLTPNGKLDRRALPAPQATPLPAGREPRTALEKELCAAFAEALGLETVGIDDNFFELGGHSLLAARLLGRLRAATGVELGLRALFEAPTVARLAELATAGGPRQDDYAVLLPLRARPAAGGPAPLFCVHPAAGIAWVYSGLLRELEPDRPLYGLQARALSEPDGAPQSLGEMAGDYLARIREVQPEGPYHLLGWSFGGTVAHEIAVRLREQGEQVALLALLDSYPRQGARPALTGDQQALAALLDSLGHPVQADAVEALTPESALGLLKAQDSPIAGASTELLRAMARGFAQHLELAGEFTPRRFDGRLLFFTATADKTAADPTAAHWAAHVAEIGDHPVDCVHGEMTRPRPIAEIGARLAAELRRTTAN
ncbi:amino acid adenylation domain-containing protein [Kitasatospora sp. NPDC050543]|uniref:amino acid adenylation domain-containing protein n=1 Tax=Kitasatospora sp. NPDC050543 TaxID=3364054 RepID=UPI003787863B